MSLLLIVNDTVLANLDQPDMGVDGFYFPLLAFLAFHNSGTLIQVISEMLDF